MVFIDKMSLRMLVSSGNELAREQTKSATKFLCVKTVSDEVLTLSHSLALLSPQKSLMGEGTTPSA